MVVMLMRRNATQAAAAAHFHCSQPTVSRRWDLLRPVIGKVLAPYVPEPVRVLGRQGTALVDGTVCPVWDWDAIPDLYSGKAKWLSPGLRYRLIAHVQGESGQRPPWTKLIMFMRAVALRKPRARVMRALTWALRASARPFEGPPPRVATMLSL